MTYLTPTGVQDFLPQPNRDLSKYCDILATLFAENGYEAVKTPGIEYFDTLAVGFGENLKRRAIRFFDQKGQLVMMRADHTTPVARMVATQMQQEVRPLRLSYMDPVYRYPDRHDSETVEIYQSGIELIGHTRPEGDLEVIRLAIRSLQALGLTDFKLEIGHVGFAEKLTPSEKKALQAGDFLELGFIPHRGGPDVVTQYPDLVSLYETLQQEGLGQYVQFNTGLVKDLQYYSGILFEGVVNGVRGTVISGGRYDQLLSKFGVDSSAVGFAIDISRLHAAGIKV